MNTLSVEQLNKDFSFQTETSNLYFRMGEGNIPVIEIQNQYASARISLQGAHLLSWQPVGEDEVIWLSTDANFAEAKSVRGGIPVCWPWFGAHEDNASYPAHGFARTVCWQVTGVRQLPAGEVQITFKLDTEQLADNYKVMWPQASVAEYSLTIASTLTLELTTSNASEQAITISEALHTYFNVEDVSITTVHGLDGIDYLDKPDGFKRKTQAGDVSINSEVDRIYVNTSGEVVIKDRKRKIHIKKQGSQSTIVWNPWKTLAEEMADLGEDGYLNMLCVESGNAADDTISIDAGKSHRLTVVYEIENI